MPEKTRTKKKKVSVAKIAKRVSKLEKATETKYLNIYPTRVNLATDGTPQIYSFFQSGDDGGTYNSMSNLVPMLGDNYNQRQGKKILVNKIDWTCQWYVPQGVAIGGGNIYGYNSVGVQQPTPSTGLVTAVFDPTGNRAVHRMVILDIKGESQIGNTNYGSSPGTYYNNVAKVYLDVRSGNQYPTYLINDQQVDRKIWKNKYDKNYAFSTGDLSAGTHITKGTLNFPKGRIVTYDDTNQQVMSNDLVAIFYSDVGNPANAYGIYFQWTLHYQDS